MREPRGEPPATLVPRTALIVSGRHCAVHGEASYGKREGNTQARRHGVLIFSRTDRPWGGGVCPGTAACGEPRGALPGVRGVATCIVADPGRNDRRMIC